MSKKFKNANQAFEHYYDAIRKKGRPCQNTKALDNIGFYILNPKDNEITSQFRKWNKKYADREWAWYLSKDRSVENIKKYAKIWDKMHNGDNIVNSNYGWQWQRNGQLDYVVNELRKNNASRRAVLTIYDAKEHETYNSDTPCTLNIVFNITNNKLNMTVLMRSNDLWYGFCNDQYCFSNLQTKVSELLDINVGWYYHFANNIHIYDDFL
jgi:thymidylate synthase